MSAPPGAARTVRDAAPRSTWKDDDVAHVAFRLDAHGASEDATRALLGMWSLRGVRQLRPFVDGIPDCDLSEHVALAALEVARRTGALPTADQQGRRGDLSYRHTPRRWPWRTSTSQPTGGAVA